MKTHLVTGASGFIGRYLIHDLLRKGHRVYALLRQPEQQFPALTRWLADHDLHDHSQLHAIYGDLSQPDLAICSADWLAMREVSVVYHAGAVMAWGLTMAAARQTNVLGATTLLRLARQHLALERFVQLSGFMLTLQPHLRRLGITAEGSADWPAVYAQVGVYEASKFEAHFAIKQLAAALGVPLTVIHPSVVIGHSQSGEIATQQDFAKTLTNLLQRRLPLVPRGNLPMIAVDELTAFMALIPDVAESAGAEYVMAHADSMTLYDALTICAQTARVPAPFAALPMGFFTALGRIRWLARRFDIEPETLSFIRPERLDLAASHAMQQRLGLPSVPLAHTLRQTTRYLQSHAGTPAQDIHAHPQPTAPAITP